MKTKKLPRVSGVLLHPTSLPSPYGIGDLGQDAYDFIDFLHNAGQHLWQILPLTHTGFGDSPYQSFSAFAGQPLIISPDDLVSLELLTKEDLKSCPKTDIEHIEYGKIIPWKTRILKLAHQNFVELTASDLPAEVDEKPATKGAQALLAEYKAFCKDHASWLDDYAMFMALKDDNGGVAWTEWDEEYKQPTEEIKEIVKKRLEKDIDYYCFIQFIFFREWMKLKEYANKKDIKIIGDIPIFVSMDSSDVWANQHLFQLDTKGYPTSVAGVPPDYFSATGQLWGNPLYRWDVHEKEGFAWWIKRVESQLTSLDYLRIDHFRGFEAYWSIPYGEKTAINGKWIKGPNQKLFKAIAEALGDDLPIIAEDLGVITDEVRELRDAFDFPGMKVLQFAFEGLGESDFHPHNFTTTNCVCYTGTHDNDTTKGWYETLNSDYKKKFRRYLNLHDRDGISYNMVRLCLSTTADFAIFPMQDLLDIGKDGRMNTPGVAAGNWSWRYKDGSLSEWLTNELKGMTKLYGRYTEKAKEKPEKPEKKEEEIKK